MPALAQPLQPLTRLARRAPAYARSDLRPDAMAGLTVAVMGVPQAMGYAIIAGVPPVYGLYTSIVACILGALFGSSRHLVTGPTNASSMVIATLTLPYLDPTDPDYHTHVVFLLTFITGLVKLGFGLLRLGGVVRYVSNSVVVGFTAGAGLLIAANQLKKVLGVTVENEGSLLYQVLWATLQELDRTNYYALTTALLTGGILVGAKRLSPRIPGALLGVAVSALLVYLMGWYEPGVGVQIVKDLRPIDRSLALFELPRFFTPGHVGEGLRLALELSSGAVAVAILGLVEAASSSRAVAASSGQRLDFSREFIGQGISNIGGAFFQNFAGSGSFTRTALNYQAGGRTRMAAIFSAGFTALTILLFAPLANYIPTASLAGMLIVIAYGMIEKKRLALALRAGSNSSLVMAVTFGATMVLPLQYAIFVGIFVSIIFLLKITGRADLTLLVPRPNERFEEVPYTEAIEEPIVLVNLEGDLYFAAVENLDYELQKIVSPRTRVVILRMKRLRAVGSTAMAVLAQFLHLLRERNVHLVVCGLRGDLSRLMQRSRLAQDIGEQNIFYADNMLFQSTELALARARSILEMEELRRRTERLGADSPAPDSPDRPFPPARELMGRQVIRFGAGHTLREAAWLLSEMHKRLENKEPVPLFLQDREGKLAGKVTPWRLLEGLTDGLSSDDLQSMDDPALGRAMAERFPTILLDIADRDIPRLDAEARFGSLLYLSAARDLRVLPIQDANHRVVGLVSQRELLYTIGEKLKLLPEPKEDEQPFEQSSQGDPQA